MNAVRNFSPSDSFYKIKDKGHIYLVSNDTRQKKMEVDGKVMSKEYLNEKLAYFYEHGGPVMDI